MDLFLDKTGGIYLDEPKVKVRGFADEAKGRRGMFSVADHPLSRAVLKVYLLILV
jgi:hypothetical protein